MMLVQGYDGKNWARHLKRQQGMFRWIDEINRPVKKMSFLKDMFEKVVLIQKKSSNIYSLGRGFGRRFWGRYFPTNPALEWNVVLFTAKSKKLIGDSWRVCFSLIKELGEGECLYKIYNLQVKRWPELEGVDSFLLSPKNPTWWRKSKNWSRKNRWHFVCQIRSFFSDYPQKDLIAWFYSVL